MHMMEVTGNLPNISAVITEMPEDSIGGSGYADPAIRDDTMAIAEATGVTGPQRRAAATSNLAKILPFTHK